jgi:hypothetical protein
MDGEFFFGLPAPRCPDTLAQVVRDGFPGIEAFAALIV